MSRQLSSKGEKSHDGKIAFTNLIKNHIYIRELANEWIK